MLRTVSRLRNFNIVIRGNCLGRIFSLLRMSLFTTRVCFCRFRSGMIVAVTMIVIMFIRMRMFSCSIFLSSCHTVGNRCGHTFRQCSSWYLFIQQIFDRSESRPVMFTNKSYGTAFSTGTGCAAYSVYIIFCVVSVSYTHLRAHETS